MSGYGTNLDLTKENHRSRRFGPEVHRKFNWSRDFGMVPSSSSISDRDVLAAVQGEGTMT
jgi:hypothetical protein